MADQLTVDVEGSKGEPYAGVDVSIDQTSSSGKTDAKGEVTLELPSGADKVTVIARHGQDTVQTPFYVRKGGARKLTIDFPYLQQQIVQQANQNTSQQISSLSPLFMGAGIVILLIIAIVVIKLRRRQPQHASRKLEGVITYHPLTTNEFP